MSRAARPLQAKLATRDAGPDCKSALSDQVSLPQDTALPVSWLQPPRSLHLQEQVPRHGSNHSGGSGTGA